MRIMGVRTVEVARFGLSRYVGGALLGFNLPMSIRLHYYSRAVIKVTFS